MAQQPHAIDDVPLTPIEKAIVSAMVAAVVRELRHKQEEPARVEHAQQQQPEGVA